MDHTKYGLSYQPYSKYFLTLLINIVLKYFRGCIITFIFLNFLIYFFKFPKWYMFIIKIQRIQKSTKKKTNIDTQTPSQLMLVSLPVGIVSSITHIFLSPDFYKLNVKNTPPCPLKFLPYNFLPYNFKCRTSELVFIHCYYKRRNKH